MTISKKEIGKRLTGFRKKKGFSVEQVGRALGKSPESIRRYEKGRGLSLHLIKRFGELYQVPDITIAFSEQAIIEGYTATLPPEVRRFLLRICKALENNNS